ncbi:MAG: enoyl-CoA hydratase/isomerase family protein [Microthrixaceae bacterium]|nr:enoyl-CoA hydratase/isomerase family protein [Microthrixaceae bacterium]
MTDPTSAPTNVDDQILYEVTDGVAAITINAPGQGNSLNAAMRDRLAERFEWASADLAVRVVVLTGAGDRHFCTGANLGGPQAPAPDRPEGAPRMTVGETGRMIKRGWQRLIASILDCEKPVIAAVNGTAAGGGAQLVLACDLVVMADSAKLVEVFVKRGIIPDAGGAYLLPRIVGPQIAKELMFLADDVPAQRCAELGIANRVVPTAELSGAVSELSGRLVDAPTKALALTKWLINRSFESSRNTAFDEEAIAQDLLTNSADFKDGIAAFGERRAPEFKGW